MVILIDSREQDPFPFNFKTKKVTFNAPDCGDYSIDGLQRVFRIERKKSGEIWSCVGCRRDSFLDQLDRLTAFPYRFLLIEGTPHSLRLSKPKRSTLSWGCVSNRLMRWTTSRAIPIWFLGSRSPESVKMVEDLMVSIHDAYKRERDFPKHWKTITEDEHAG